MYFAFPVKFGDAIKCEKEDQLLDEIDENLVMKALDGFLIILSTEGDVIYVSENIQEYIGIQQVRIFFNSQVKSISNNSRNKDDIEREREGEQKSVDKSLEFIVLNVFIFVCGVDLD